MLVYSLILLSNVLLGCSVSLNHIPFQMMMHQMIEEHFKSRVFSLTTKYCIRFDSLIVCLIWVVSPVSLWYRLCRLCCPRIHRRAVF